MARDSCLARVTAGVAVGGAVGGAVGISLNPKPSQQLLHLDCRFSFLSSFIESSCSDFVPYCFSWLGGYMANGTLD